MSDRVVASASSMPDSPRVSDTDVAIEMVGVNKWFGSFQALKDINLKVTKGERIVVCGPSGSGKSTLMNLIGCLDTPSQGQYWLNGKNVSEMDDDELARIRNQEVGFVFQTFNLLARATSLHNVELPLIYSGVGSEARLERAKQALRHVDLEQRMYHKPSELSGGQRQRVAVARALVNNPSILLADEPTGNLDTENSNIVLGVLRDLNERLGQTILMITHNPEAAAYGHRIVQMRDGRIAG